MKLLFLIFAVVLSFQGIAINLQDAIKQRLIQVTSKGLGGYTGEVIELEIKNISGKLLQLEINSGLFLMPEDTSVQRMMIAQDLPFALANNATKRIKVNAFCTQSKNASPSESSLFKIGKLAEGKLLELAKIISKNRFFSSAAQNAVWCLTDHSDLYSIYSSNPLEYKILREFVSKATGQPLELQLYKSANTQTPTQQRTYIEHTVKDTIRFVNREEGSTTLALFDSTGKELLLFFKDRPLRKGSNVRYSYSFTYANIKEHEVFVRLQRNTGELIYEKKIIILD